MVDITDAQELERLVSQVPSNEKKDFKEFLVECGRFKRDGYEPTAWGWKKG